MMRRADEFVAMILTHGRPDRVHTLKSLRRHGYTGRVAIVIDDEDDRAADYRREFGDDVVIFSKRDAAVETDEADNRTDLKGVVYARNASWSIARRLGARYFVQLDDDYLDFRHKRDERDLYINKADIRDLDAVFDAMLDYFYSVVFAPSCVKVSMMGSRFRRIHHAVAWSRAVPRILPERYRKPRPELEG